MMKDVVPELILKRIRNCYRTIHVFTVECISANTANSLTTLIANREELMTVIAGEEEKITLHNELSSEECLRLRTEIESIIMSIVLLDGQLEVMCSNTLHKLRRELSTLYIGGRAASAYAVQARG